MREHWRLGIVERSVLESLDQLEARPDRHHVKSARAVQHLASEFGVSPRYGYESLCALSQPWRQFLPLVDFHGNNGSPDDSPAGARYTEARLSVAGALALAAERGTGPRVPVTLINGNLHLEGSAPPYSPGRVIATVLALSAGDGMSDAEIVDRVGPPESTTGCTMKCNYFALAAGERTELRMAARVQYEDRDGSRVIVLTHLPLDVGAATVEQALAARVTAHRYRERNPDSTDFGDLGLPLRRVQDESREYVTRIVCEPREGVDIERCAEQIAATWGVTTRVSVQLPAPLPVLVRELADEDPAALRTALASLSGS